MAVFRRASAELVGSSLFYITLRFFEACAAAPFLFVSRARAAGPSPGGVRGQIPQSLYQPVSGVRVVATLSWLFFPQRLFQPLAG